MSERYDPHGYRKMFFLIFTPVGWLLIVAFHVASVVRGVFAKRKGRR